MRGLYELYQSAKEDNLVAEKKTTKKKTIKRKPGRSKNAWRKPAIKRTGVVIFLGNFKPKWEDLVEIEKKEKFIRMIGRVYLDIDKSEREMKRNNGN